MLLLYSTPICRSYRELQEDMKELWDVAWQPAAAGAIPVHPIEQPKGAGGKAKAFVPVKAQAYRPPGARGTQSSSKVDVPAKLRFPAESLYEDVNPGLFWRDASGGGGGGSAAALANGEMHYGEVHPLDDGGGDEGSGDSKRRGPGRTK